jgi:hypothetical protein
VAPVGASAAPTVEFRARSEPIAGFPGTGNLAGAGEALEIEYAIAGTEYGGFPPPTTGFNLYLPAGTRVYPLGFPTCPDYTLEPNSPAPGYSCALAKAGPTGEVKTFVAFGKEVDAESATIEARYSTGGGLQFFTFGHEPVLLEALLKGHFFPADGEYAALLDIEVPLIETVPGGQDASLSLLRDKFGSAIRSGGKTIYYLRAPSQCAKGYEPYKGEVTFAAVGRLPAQTVTSEYHGPCPRPRAEPQAQPLPGTEGVVTAPSNKVCVSKRDFRIHIVHIPHLTYQLVTVEVNGKPVKVLRGKRQSAQIDLKGLPKGTYVARIGVVTTSGRLITGTRTYHTCAAHAIHPTRPPTL